MTTPLTPLSPLVIVLKTLTLALGALVTALGTKAAWRTGSRPMAMLAVGFGVVTLGSLAAGVADQVLTVSAGIALTLESGLTTLGFAVIALSLFVAVRST